MIGVLPHLRGLYRLSYRLTYLMLQPIHLVCIDERTRNLYILARNTENIEIQITSNGEVF
jgi:hypothetical protein